MKCVTEPGNMSRNDVMCLFFNFEKGCGHTGLPRPFHTEKKTTNFPFLLVDKWNREFFPEKFSQEVEMSFFKNVNPIVHRWRHIAFRKKRSFEHFEISFLKKKFYFAYLLTKRKKIEPIRSNIHLLVFALYEMVVADQYGHTLFQNLKISTSHHF